jgi:hypothetical protein
MTIYNADFQPVDPYAPIGQCDICGAAAWTASIHGLLCPSHENVLDECLSESEYKPDAYELIDALADVGITATVQYPYVIIDTTATDANRCVSPEMVSWSLDIDPALCVRNLNGGIRITCD